MLPYHHHNEEVTTAGRVLQEVSGNLRMLTAKKCIVILLLMDALICIELWRFDFSCKLCARALQFWALIARARPSGFAESTSLHHTSFIVTQVAIWLRIDLAEGVEREGEAW